MNAIQKLIQHVKEGWEFSDYQDQIELAEIAQVEFDQITNLKNDAHARLVELGMTMPCGHLSRYAVNGEDGTQYCVMCAAAETEKRLQIAKSALGQIASGKGFYGQQAYQYKELAKSTMEKL